MDLNTPELELECDSSLPSENPKQLRDSHTNRRRPSCVAPYCGNTWYRLANRKRIFCPIHHDHQTMNQANVHNQCCCKPHYKLYHFPVSKEGQRIWATALGVDLTLIDRSKIIPSVCSEHKTTVIDKIEYPDWANDQTKLPGNSYRYAYGDNNSYRADLLRRRKEATKLFLNEVSRKEFVDDGVISRLEIARVSGCKILVTKKASADTSAGRSGQFGDRVPTTSKPVFLEQCSTSVGLSGSADKKDKVSMAAHGEFGLATSPSTSGLRSKTNGFINRTGPQRNRSRGFPQEDDSSQSPAAIISQPVEPLRMKKKQKFLIIRNMPSAVLNDSVSSLETTNLTTTTTTTIKQEISPVDMSSPTETHNHHPGSVTIKQEIIDSKPVDRDIFQQSESSGADNTQDLFIRSDYSCLYGAQNASRATRSVGIDSSERVSKRETTENREERAPSFEVDMYPGPGTDYGVEIKDVKRELINQPEEEEELITPKVNPLVSLEALQLQTDNFSTDSAVKARKGTGRGKREMGEMKRKQTEKVPKIVKRKRKQKEETEKEKCKTVDKTKEESKVKELSEGVVIFSSESDEGTNLSADIESIDDSNIIYYRIKELKGSYAYGCKICLMERKLNLCTNATKNATTQLYFPTPFHTAQHLRDVHKLMEQKLSSWTESGDARETIKLHPNSGLFYCERCEAAAKRIYQTKNAFIKHWRLDHGKAIANPNKRSPCTMIRYTPIVTVTLCSFCEGWFHDIKNHLMDLHMRDISNIETLNLKTKSSSCERFGFQCNKCISNGARFRYRKCGILIMHADYNHKSSTFVNEYGAMESYVDAKCKSNGSLDVVSKDDNDTESSSAKNVSANPNVALKDSISPNSNINPTECNLIIKKMIPTKTMSITGSTPDPKLLSAKFLKTKPRNDPDPELLLPKPSDERSNVIAAPNGEFMCAICMRERNFYDPRSVFDFENHWRRVHNQPLDPQIQKLYMKNNFKCAVCTAPARDGKKELQTFWNKFMVAKHLSDVHNFTNIFICLWDKIEMVKQQPGKEGLFYCIRCEDMAKKIYESKDQFLSHCIRDHDPNDYRPTCNTIKWRMLNPQPEEMLKCSLCPMWIGIAKWNSHTSAAHGCMKSLNHDIPFAKLGYRCSSCIHQNKGSTFSREGQVVDHIETAHQMPRSGIKPVTRTESNNATE